MFCIEYQVAYEAFCTFFKVYFKIFFHVLVENDESERLICVDGGARNAAGGLRFFFAFSVEDGLG